MSSSILSTGRVLIVVALSSLPTAWAAPPGDSSLLPTVERQNRLLAAQARAEVDSELRAANARMDSDPAAVEQRLKLLMARVIQIPQLPADERASLRSQLETALRQASRRALIKEATDSQMAAERAAEHDRRRIAGVLARNQEALKQLMDRFDSLMDEGRYEAADSIAVNEVSEVGADTTMAASARLVARQAGAHLVNMALRQARQKSVVTTLASVETSHLPSPDDEPMVYPRAANWEELSQRRKEQATVALERLSAADARIVEQLRSPTTLELLDTPLADVADYLKDLHGIEIQLDRKALAEAGISGDTPISVTIKGVSLRSALRQVFRALDLSFVVKDEVLLITTSDVAGREMVARAYSVAELVVPIAAARSDGMGTSGAMSSPGLNGPGMNGPGMNGPGNNMPGMNFPGMPGRGMNAPGNGMF